MGPIIFEDLEKIKGIDLKCDRTKSILKQMIENRLESRDVEIYIEEGSKKGIFT